MQWLIPAEHALHREAQLSASAFAGGARLPYFGTDPFSALGLNPFFISSTNLES